MSPISKSARWPARSRGGFSKPAIQRTWKAALQLHAALDRNCCNKLRKNEHDALTAGDVALVVKRNVLLVTNSGNIPGSASANDQTTTERRENAIDVLSLALDDIDLAIVDIGASLQSLAIVETLTQREPAPPVIALVEGYDTNAMSALHQHGATACLRKPFNADELARLVEVVCASTSRDNAPLSDKWGHVRASASGSHEAT